MTGDATDREVSEWYALTRTEHHDECELCGVDICCGEECCEGCPNREDVPPLLGMVDRCRMGDL